MSKLEKAFVSTSGKVWKKVRGSDNRVYHFADGTPKSEHAFNTTYGRHKKYDGRPAKIAVPSKKGPGFERKEVNATVASSLGRELAVKRNRGDENMNTQEQNIIESFTIEGKEYSLDQLYELNQRLVQRYGPQSVMTY